MMTSPNRVRNYFQKKKVYEIVIWKMIGSLGDQCVKVSENDE